MLETVNKVKKQLNKIIKKLNKNGASPSKIRLQQLHNDYFIQITTENCLYNENDKLYSTALGTRPSMLSSTQTDVQIQNTNNAVNNRTGGNRHHFQRSTMQEAPIPEGRSSDSGNVNDANEDSCGSRSYEQSDSNCSEGDEQESEAEDDRPWDSPEPSAVDTSTSSSSSRDLFDSSMSRRTTDLNQRPLPSCHSVLSVSSRHPDFGSPLTPSIKSIYDGNWVCVPRGNVIHSMSQSSSLSNNESGDEIDEDSSYTGNDTRKSYNTTLANLTVHQGSFDIPMQDNSKLETTTREFALRLLSLQTSSLDSIESWKVRKPIIYDNKNIIMETILSTQNILHFTSKNSFTTVAQNSIWSIIAQKIFSDLSGAAKQDLVKYFVTAAKSNGYFGTTISLIIDIHKNHCNNIECQDS